jgi:hypothetical protein
MRSWQLSISFRSIHIWTYARSGVLETALQPFIVKSVSIFTPEQIFKKLFLSDFSVVEGLREYIALETYQQVTRLCKSKKANELSWGQN